jgi:hypothetical protein
MLLDYEYEQLINILSYLQLNKLNIGTVIVNGKVIFKYPY